MERNNITLKRVDFLRRKVKKKEEKTKAPQWYLKPDRLPKVRPKIPTAIGNDFQVPHFMHNRNEIGCSLAC